MSQKAEIVICGAGITGVAAAHFLSKAGFKNTLLLDEHHPKANRDDVSRFAAKHLYYGKLETLGRG